MVGAKDVRPPISRGLFHYPIRILFPSSFLFSLSGNHNFAQEVQSFECELPGVASNSLKSAIDLFAALVPRNLKYQRIDGPKKAKGRCLQYLGVNVALAVSWWLLLADVSLGGWATGPTCCKYMTRPTRHDLSPLSAPSHGDGLISLSPSDRSDRTSMRR